MKSWFNQLQPGEIIFYPEKKIRTARDSHVLFIFDRHVSPGAGKNLPLLRGKDKFYLAAENLASYKTLRTERCSSDDSDDSDDSHNRKGYQHIPLLPISLQNRIFPMRSFCW